MPPANFPPADPLAGEDAELGSTQRVLRLLDKTSRAARTYGLDNAATTRFFEQLQSEMGAHLEKWSVLGVVVERGDLLVRDQLVFQSEEGAGEGLVFRLYGDGIRELRFHQGAGPEDLRAFLEALWGSDKDSDADDDIVTRLWAKDLPTISFVTADQFRACMHRVAERAAAHHDVDERHQRRISHAAAIRELALEDLTGVHGVRYSFSKRARTFLTAWKTFARAESSLHPSTRATSS